MAVADGEAELEKKAAIESEPLKAESHVAVLVEGAGDMQGPAELQTEGNKNASLCTSIENADLDAAIEHEMDSLFVVGNWKAMLMCFHLENLT